MGSSSSRLDQLEGLVLSLRTANAQLERQLLSISGEGDALKRADLTRIIQAENGKLMQESERNQAQLAEEIRKMRVAGAGEAAQGQVSPQAQADQALDVCAIERYLSGR